MFDGSGALRSTPRMLRAALSALVLSASSATAQDDIALLLEPIRAQSGIAAMGGMVVTRDGVEALGVTGTRVHGGTDPARPGDAWHIGSLTKMLTAVLAARLAEQDILSFGTTVGEVLGEEIFVREEYRDVTLRELLVHRAGLISRLNDQPVWPSLHDETVPVTQRRLALAEFILSRDPLSEPGTDFEYANAGYIVAGAMMEALTLSTWENLVENHVFSPLNMVGAGFGPPEGIRGHWALDDPLPLDLADNPSPIGPAGTVHMPLADYAKFLKAMLDGLDGEGDFLRPETIAALFTPEAGESYVMGWGVDERGWAGGRAFFHLGSNQIWTAVVWLAPERGFAAVAVANAGRDYAEAPLDRAIVALIERHLSLND
jgi:D-alanyl-D-alanine carboxypeptidase